MKLGALPTDTLDTATDTVLVVRDVAGVKTDIRVPATDFGTPAVPTLQAVTDVGTITTHAITAVGINVSNGTQTSSITTSASAHRSNALPDYSAPIATENKIVVSAVYTLQDVKTFNHGLPFTPSCITGFTPKNLATVNLVLTGGGNPYFDNFTSTTADMHFANVITGTVEGYAVGHP